MVGGRDCGALIRSFGRIARFLGVRVGPLGFFWDARFSSLFLDFLWDFPLMCFGGSGVLSHGASSRLGFHG